VNGVVNRELMVHNRYVASKKIVKEASDQSDDQMQNNELDVAMMKWQGNKFFGVNHYSKLVSLKYIWKILANIFSSRRKSLHKAI
jgi:hypothetical protein